MVVLAQDLRMVVPVQEVRLDLHRTVVPGGDLHRMIIQDPALGHLHPAAPAPAPREANMAQALQATIRDLQATVQVLQAMVALAQIHGVPLAPGQDPTTQTAPQSSSTKPLPIPRHMSVSPKKPKQNPSNTRIQSRNLMLQKIPSRSRLRCIIRLHS
jgi:hypothetical protein